jgi:hypothetical protein
MDDSKRQEEIRLLKEELERNEEERFEALEREYKQIRAEMRAIERSAGI